MLKLSHVKIASETLNNIQSKIDWKINKKAFLIGSVLPDINFVFPTHTIAHTLKRFKKKLTRIDKTESNMIKSITLGVVTHYICDYFCYAHNLKSPDPKHALYENYMHSHIKKHENNLAHWSDEVIYQWEDIKCHITECIKQNNKKDLTEDILGKIHTDGINHIQYIVEAVSDMHKDYLEQTKELDTEKWYNSLNKIELDIEYATFMCEKIALWILNPSLEIGVLSN